MSVFVFRVGGYCLGVDISVIYGYSLLYSGHYIGSIMLGDRQIFCSCIFIQGVRG